MTSASSCIAPAVLVGKSNEHLGYSGTLSISRDILYAEGLRLCRGLIALGFRRCAFLNAHGGNAPVLRSLVAELGRMENFHCRLLDNPGGFSTAARENQLGIHAGEIETAWLMALEPQLVRSGKRNTAWIADGVPAGFEPSLTTGPVRCAWLSKDISPTGTMGDATAATAENGKRWFDQTVEDYLNQLQAFTEQD